MKMRIARALLSFLMVFTCIHAQESPDPSIAVPDASLRDVEGNEYRTVKIGNQVWMAENLRVTKYSDGQAIPNVLGASSWGRLTTPGYCFGRFPASNRDLFGAWYNWHAVNSGKLAPKGWHVPTVAEWKTLAAYLGGERDAGGRMKATGTDHWLSPNTGATNSSGFSAYPAGYRNYDGYDLTAPGNIKQAIDHASFWTSDEAGAMEAYGTRLTADSREFAIARYAVAKTYGYSVRCIKD